MLLSHEIIVIETFLRLIYEIVVPIIIIIHIHIDRYEIYCTFMKIGLIDI